MMHSDFVIIDEKFSDSETTDREMYLEDQLEEMNIRVLQATNSSEIYKALELK